MGSNFFITHVTTMKHSKQPYLWEFQGAFTTSTLKDLPSISSRYVILWMCFHVLTWDRQTRKISFKKEEVLYHSVCIDYRYTERIHSTDPRFLGFLDFKTWLPYYSRPFVQVLWKYHRHQVLLTLGETSKLWKWKRRKFCQGISLNDKSLEGHCYGPLSKKQ